MGKLEGLDGSGSKASQQASADNMLRKCLGMEQKFRVPTVGR